jgi:uncharacterized protein (TIGR02996 family)
LIAAGEPDERGRHADIVCLDPDRPAAETTVMAADTSSPLARWIGHPDFEAFALAIAVEPDDDALRLVVSEWLRAQGDDAAADLTRGTLFPMMLAVARFEKVTGKFGGEAVRGMFEAFRGAGEATRAALAPAAEAILAASVTIAEAHEHAERSRPAAPPASRSGRRNKIPKATPRARKRR